MSQPQTIFFVDRCLGGKKVPEALRNAGITVEFHDDHFPKEATDTEWIPKVGEKGWIILTKDIQIGKRSLEKIAVANAGIKMFVLATKNMAGDDMATTFVKAIKSMQDFARNNSAPFIAKVYRDGRVEAWKNAEDLQSDL